MSDWTENRKPAFVTNGIGNRDRAYLDYYATDPRAVTELLKREVFDIEILEPACGGGGTFPRH